MSESSLLKLCDELEDHVCNAYEIEGVNVQVVRLVKAARVMHQDLTSIGNIVQDDKIRNYVQAALEDVDRIASGEQ